MSATLILLALLLPDVVHVRQGKPIEGRIFEYERWLEIEQPDGRCVFVPKTKVERVDLAADLVPAPGIFPFPADALPEGSEWDYLPFHNTLIALSRVPGRTIAAFDFATGKKIWQHEFPNRVGNPITAGRAIYLVQKESFVDEKRKYKSGGSQFSKDVHRLTLTALDPETGAFLWSQAFDNNDRRDLLWEPTTLPTLWITPDRVICLLNKHGCPIDSDGNVNRSAGRDFSTLYTYNTKDKKVLAAVDSSEAADMKGRAFLTDDALLLIRPGADSSWQILGIDLSSGKVRWKSGEIRDKFHSVVGDTIYALTDTHIVAYSAKNGKKFPDWEIEHTGGDIAGIDARHVYLYRKRRNPRAILGYETEKAVEAFRIDIPEGNDFTHMKLVGHRMLYSDHHQTLYAYDTTLKQPMWSWKGIGTGQTNTLYIMGSGVAFQQNRNIVYLDLDTGRKRWELEASYRSLIPVGTAGLVGFKFPLGTEAVRRGPPPPPEAEFFTPSNVPLRHYYHKDIWSPPAFTDKAILTVSSAGSCAAIAPGDFSSPWSIDIAPSASLPLCPPLARGNTVAVAINGSTFVHDATTRARIYRTPHVPLRQQYPWPMAGEDLVLASGSAVVRVEAATGKKVWECRARLVRDYEIVGDVVHVLTLEEIQTIALRTGEPARTIPSPHGGTMMAIDPEHIFVAIGPTSLHLIDKDGEQQEIFRAPDSRDRLPMDFRGSLASSGRGDAIFSHGGGEVACFAGITGKPRWSFRAPKYTSLLLVHEGRVWFAAEGEGLLGLNTATGATEWSVKVPNAGRFTPFLRAGKVAFWSSDGWLVHTEPETQGAPKEEETPEVTERKK